MRLLQHPAMGDSLCHTHGGIRRKGHANSMVSIGALHVLLCLAHPIQHDGADDVAGDMRCCQSFESHSNYKLRRDGGIVGESCKEVEARSGRDAVNRFADEREESRR